MFTSMSMTPNHLFSLNLNIKNFPYLNTVIDDNNWLQHMRFMHLNFDSLRFLSSKRMVDRLSSIRNLDIICDICILKKQHRDVCQIGESQRARRPLKIIHLDLYTMEVASNSGCRYFIIFINNFSRETWVYFLKQKSNAHETFKIFKTLLRSKMDVRLKF